MILSTLFSGTISGLSLIRGIRTFGASVAQLAFKRKRKNQYLKTPFQTGMCEGQIFGM
jgi:hypothetical protein